MITIVKRIQTNFRAENSDLVDQYYTEILAYFTRSDREIHLLESGWQEANGSLAISPSPSPSGSDLGISANIKSN